MEPEIPDGEDADDTQVQLEAWKRKCKANLRSDFVTMILNRISDHDQQYNSRKDLLADSDGDNHPAPTIDSRMNSDEGREAIGTLQAEFQRDYKDFRSQSSTMRSMTDWILGKIGVTTDDEYNSLSVVVLGLSGAALDGLKTVSTVQSEGEITYGNFETKKWWSELFSKDQVFGTVATASLLAGATLAPIPTAAAAGFAAGSALISGTGNYLWDIGRNIANTAASGVSTAARGVSSMFGS